MSTKVKSLRRVIIKGQFFFFKYSMRGVKYPKFALISDMSKRPYKKGPPKKYPRKTGIFR